MSRHEFAKPSLGRRDDRSIRWVLERALKADGIDVTTFQSADETLVALRRETPSVLVSDIRMPGTDGLTMLGEINSRYPEMPVIIMTAYSDLDSAVSAYQGGAFEYLPKPFDVDEALSLVRRALEQARAADRTQELVDNPAPKEIIGSAAAMQDVFRAIGRLSRSNITVLITGESGTVKNNAQALHRHSPRGTSIYRSNTAAIPRDLLESGTGTNVALSPALRRNARAEQADGGTLFLDEIGDMLADLQTRLLRVLADGEFYRVGGHTPIKSDVRIIAATHQIWNSRSTLVHSARTCIIA